MLQWQKGRVQGCVLCAAVKERVVPAASTCCLGAEKTPLADGGEGSSVAEPEC
jgi:hypothetical protein